MTASLQVNTPLQSLRPQTSLTIHPSVQSSLMDSSLLSASAALNKWLKPRVNEDAVMHSLRHSMRDRLRAVECPSEMIEQIGGWSSSTVGSSYGKGYELPVLAKWMKMMER